MADSTNMENPILTIEALTADTEPLTPKQAFVWKYLLNRLSESEARCGELQRQVNNLEKVVYGPKSEKTEVVFEHGEQMNIFDEAEAESTEKIVPEEKTVKVSGHTRKVKASHKETFENLPVEEVVHPVEDKTCPACGREMKHVGKEFVRDEVVYYPARMVVRKHYVEVVKCPSCGKDESLDASLPDVPAPVFGKATVPSPVIPRSYCSPELLAHIIYQKYAQAVPLYRQEKDYAALGMKLSRTTMANWILYAATQYGKPVYEAMKAELLSGKVIHADETVVQVLHEENRRAKTQSRMWVYAAPKSAAHANVLFEYTKTRNGDNAVRFLGDYKGYLVCDGYDGYNKLSSNSVTRCGCWAHVRRKFADALPREDAQLSTSKAAEGVRWCNQIFELEREYDGLDQRTGQQVRPALTPEERYTQRQERTKPVLDAFYAWLDSFVPAGGTGLAKACQYARNEKKYLYAFLHDPAITPDNNRAENAIRPFVVGRKNWLFSDSEKGAEASAILYSLAATACANGLTVEGYFTRLFASRDIILPWHTDEQK